MTPKEVRRAFSFAKSVQAALRKGSKPPRIPKHFTFEEARLARVALWQYARKSGIAEAAIPPEIAALMAQAKEGEEWKAS